MELSDHDDVYGALTDTENGQVIRIRSCGVHETVQIPAVGDCVYHYSMAVDRSVA